LHDLEESNTGDQFQIQDLASAPTAPFKPSVFAYVLAGIGLGIALGVGAAAAREFVDQSVRSEDEFASVFPGLAVYGVIPSLDVGPKSSRRSDARSHGAGGLA
jgi:capsular polysaccharide biosynthesis protein